MKRSLFIPFTIVIVCILPGFVAPAFSQDPSNVFQKGLLKEEGDGSLQEAIELYNQVVENTSAERSLRANALLHVGICYEKLGQEQAKRTYRKLISEYADQGEIVAIGKKKLASLDEGIQAAKSDEIIIREVWAPGGDTYGVSPDGRYLNYIDWDAIELGVRDVKTGKNRLLTNRGTWEDPVQFPDISVWSPDGKQLAYYWFNGENTEIWIATPDRSEDRLVCSGKDLPWPIDWSPDGKHLLAINTIDDPDKRLGHYDEIVLLSVKDGSISSLKIFDELHTCHLKFSPDGKYIALDLGCDKRGEDGDIYLFSVDGSEEGWLVKNPANDREVLWTRDGKGILFLSDRMGTTDLWKLKVENGKSAGEPEIVKSNLGERTQLLGITYDQTLYYSQSFARSDLFMAELDFLTGEIISKPVRISTKEGIRNVNPALSPDGRYIAYFQDGKSDYQLGNRFMFIIYDTETGEHRKLPTDLYGIPHEFWSSPQWTRDGKSLLVNGTNKNFMRGFYLVDSETGKEKPLLVSKTEPREYRANGLFPNFSRDGKNLYYLTQDKTKILKRNLESSTETEIFSSEDQIVTYRISPDEKQIVLGYWFNERHILYTVPVAGGTLTKFAAFREDQRPAVLGWSADQDYVLVQVHTPGDQTTLEILRIPAKGGDPEHVIMARDLFPNGFYRELSICPERKTVLAVIDSSNDSGVWALENLFE